MKSRSKYLILGSGFVAHELGELFKRDTDIEPVFVDTSQALQAMRVTSNTPAFMPEMVDLTRRQGGGANVWGGKVTIPTSKNWLAQIPQNGSWNIFATWCEAWLTNSRDTVFTAAAIPGSLRSPPAREIVTSNLVLEENVFLPDTDLVNNSVVEFSRRALVATSNLAWTFDEVLGMHSFSWRDDSSISHTVEAEIVFLASGAIGNAKLISLLTAQTVFPVGNHLEINLGYLKFPRYRRLGYFGYLHHGKNFYSFAKTESNGLQHSVRLVPSSRTTRSLGEIKFGRGRFLAQLTELVLLRLGFVREVGVDLWLDTGKIGTVTFCLGKNNEFLEENYSCSETSIRYILSNATVRANLNNLCGLDGEFVPRPEKDLVLRDTSHYFGTIPIADRHQAFPHGSAVVDSNLHLEVDGIRNVYILGSSAFAIGSHGHPTLMAVSTAHRAAESALVGLSR